MPNPFAELPGVWKSYVLAFSTFSRIICKRLEEEMARDGIDLSPRQGWVLMAAEELPLSQGLTADILGINANVMVRVVDSLEARGLIKRVKNLKNRRESRLVVTTKGKLMLKKMFSGWERRTIAIFRPVSPEEVERCSHMAKAVILDYYESKT